jgi:branched-chain amino acid transport system ATP-binding protein
VLTLDRVTMRFGGLTAVDEVSLSIPSGRITGLIGPNGAGKSTAFNILAGLLRPTAGRVLLEGEEITALSPHERAGRGIARTFQLPHEFGRLTVLENLMVSAAQPLGESVFNVVLRRGAYTEEERAAHDKARRLLALLELDKVRGALAGTLSGGQKKLLELGRALMREPKVVLLDEIGAGINRSLLTRLADKIRQINTETGVTFCLIEHDLDYVSRLCSEVTVMAQGRVLARGAISDVRADERVIEAYFGGGRYEDPR